MQPTGDKELDLLAEERIKAEVARLERNADRREAREKQKSKHAGSPAAAVVSPAPSEAADGATPQKGRGRTKDGTARKCANCGQVGHIKTNRKLVPFTCLFCNSDRFEEILPPPTERGGKRHGPSDGRPGAGAGASSSYSAFAL